jgi:hypothetical protein
LLLDWRRRAVLEDVAKNAPRIPQCLHTSQLSDQTCQWFIQSQFTQSWGLTNDIPVPGDYDGNGTGDRVVYRDGQWLFQATGVSVFWGLAGDIPAPLPPPIYLAFFD